MAGTARRYTRVVSDMPRLVRLTAIASLAVVAVIVAGCIEGAGGRGPASRSGASNSSPTPSSVTKSDGTFELTISTPNARIAPNEPIPITTTLTYVGPKPGIEAAGSGGGLVAFSLEEVGGTRSIHSAITADCRTGYRFTRGVPVEQRFGKSGGFSQEDPNADFIRTYLTDPVLRLPVGRWRIVADLIASDGMCDAGAHVLSAPLEITVG